MKSKRGSPARLVAWMLIVSTLELADATVLAENTDPTGSDSQYAYAENVGWLNAEPGGDSGDGIQVNNLDLTGWMWGENIGWVSMSCDNTGSCGTVAYGVLNDACGNLTG